MASTKHAETGKKDKFVPLQKLSPEIGNCGIIVRVSRLWEAYNLKNNRELISMEMVLIDAEGSYIHASIKGNYVHLFQNRIEEGGIYYIKNFEVVDNKTSYRVVADNKFMLQFYANSNVTLVSEGCSQIPNHRFDLLDFDKVPPRLRKDYILTDVVGQVCSEGDVNHLNIRGRTVKCLMLELQDMSTTKLRLTLWDKSVDDYLKQKCNVKGHVIVGVFTSNLVKKYYNKLTLSTTTASKVYLDVQIDEVDALKKKYSPLCNGNPITPLRVERHDVDTTVVISQLKTIRDLLNIAKTDFKDGVMFYCHALIYDINNTNGWYYNSCGHCKTLIKPSGGKFWCKNCEKDLDDAVTRFRVELKVKDEADNTKFIIFDDVAEKVIGQSAIALYDMEEKLAIEKNEVELHALIGNLIGQRFVFRVKLTAYNKTAYTQSFTSNQILMETILGPPQNSKDIGYNSTGTSIASTSTTQAEENLIDKNENKKRRLSDNSERLGDILAA